MTTNISQTTAVIMERVTSQREAILRLADHYGAYNVRIFGSVARGEAAETSDLDLLVKVREGTSMFDLVGLWLDLQTLLDCKISLVDEASISGEFAANARRDAVQL